MEKINRKFLEKLKEKFIYIKQSIWSFIVSNKWWIVVILILIAIVININLKILKFYLKVKLRLFQKHWKSLFSIYLYLFMSSFSIGG